MSERALLEDLLGAGLAAVEPARAMRGWLDRAEGRFAGRRLRVVAAGKAAGPMARALDARFADRIVDGLVVTRGDHDAGPPGFELRVAGHPLPDERSAAAGAEVLARAAACAPDEVFVLLLSGGASALLTAPVDGVPVSELRGLTEALMHAGADIEELNTVRSQLTKVSGGRLARACNAGSVEVAAISDVPGDRLEILGSGPCAPDRSCSSDAARILEARLGDRVPESIGAVLRARSAEPPPAPAAFAHVRHQIVARNEDALRAVEARAAELGLSAVRSCEALRGEAREAGERLVAEARALARSGSPAGLLLAGGETTVNVRGGGSGGRNQELALAAACALAGDPSLSVLAAGSDGSDGPTDAAGAYADGGTVERGRAAGVDAAARLADNDSYGFFAAEGGLLRTGPTGTNVMDLALVAIGTAGGRSTREAR